MQPNILLIFTDQHRFDCLGAMGDPLIKTPNLDKLAEQGVVFDNAYCPSPVCGPSRASIFTGEYPSANGVIKNHLPFNRGKILLTDILAQQGYYNALVGKLHFIPVIGRFGFHYKMLHDSPHDIYSEAELKYSEYIKYLKEGPYKNADHEQLLHDLRESETAGTNDFFFWMGKNILSEEEHEASWNGREAARFIDNYQDEAPFFLNVSFFGPHHPYAIPEPWSSLYDPDEIELPETFRREAENRPVFDCKKSKMREERMKWGERKYRQMVASYYGYVSMIDHNIGRIMDSLQKKGVFDNTMIIFTSDHGDHIGDFGLTGKGDMYDSSAKVPFIIKPPGGLKKSVRVNKVVNNLDVFATCCDIAGYDFYDIDQELNESNSLLPCLRENPELDQIPGETYSIHGASPKNNQVMYRQGNLVLMATSREDEPVYELYDVAQDPMELDNLFMLPDWEKESAEMKNKLDTWWRKQNSRYP